MHSNSHAPHYVNVLMAETEQPPFSEVRELVLNYRGRPRRSPFPKTYLFEGMGLLLLGILLGVRAPVGNSYPRTIESLAKALPHPLRTIVSATNKCSSQEAQTVSGSHAAEQLSIADVKTPLSFDSSAITLCKGTNPSMPSAANAVARMAATSFEERLSTPSSSNSWSLLASGDCGLFGFGIGSLTRSLSWSLGLRYSLSSSSSIIIEARRTSLPANASSIQYGQRDTVLTVGGTPYTNTIGSATTIMSRSFHSISTIDAGYEYRFGSPLWSPVVGVMIGTNGSGWLSSASVGIDYPLVESTQINLSIRADQFVTKGKTPEQRMGLVLGLSYSW